MKSIEQWLAEYGESHQNETNKTIHWICVPAIFFSIAGMLYGIKLPFIIRDVQMNVAILCRIIQNNLDRHAVIRSFMLGIVPTNWKQ